MDGWTNEGSSPLSLAQRTGRKEGEPDKRPANTSQNQWQSPGAENHDVMADSSKETLEFPVTIGIWKTIADSNSKALTGKQYGLVSHVLGRDVSIKVELTISVAVSGTGSVAFDSESCQPGHWAKASS